VKITVKKALIIEAVVLLIMAFIFRFFIFDHMVNGMMHVIFSLHVFMIGATASAFTIIALTIKRAWKTHGIYLLFPLIFALFGFILQQLAEEISIPL